MVERFHPRHIDQISEWHRLQEAAPLCSVIPPVGFIEEGVAAGFLIQTDSGFAMLDGYVSNPEAPSEVRHEAFLAITERLLEAAREKECKMVLAISRDPSIICRATTLHDFKDLGLYCLLNREV